MSESNDHVRKVRRVLMQHSRRLVREALCALIDAEPDLTVVAALGSCSTLWERVASERPDVVLLEDGRPDVIRSRLVAPAGRPPAVVVLREGGTSRGRLGISDIEGASGLLSALRCEAAPRQDPPREAAETATAGSVRRGQRLTPRERDVLDLISSGYTTREVSARLGISPKTVESHKQRLFTKLGVSSQAHAVAVAVREGYLQVHLPCFSFSAAVGGGG